MIKYTKKKLINKFKFNLYIYYNIKENMIVIKVEKGEGLEKALKRYKYKVIKTKQIEELRARQEYVKNTTKKREKMKKAKYVQKLQESKYL